MSSWISSGATSLRVHDSSQRGFGGAAGSVEVLAAFCLSFDVKTFLKKGIVGDGGAPGEEPATVLTADGGDAVAQREGARCSWGSAMQGLKLFNCFCFVDGPS